MQGAGGSRSAVLPKAPELSVESGSESPRNEINNDEAGAAVKEATTIASNHQEPSVTLGTPAASGNKNIESNVSLDSVDEENVEESKANIADPLEPFNRAMYHFNDKLYFWVLKPVAQGYGKVVPENARISVRNFFSNFSFPIRFVNCLLQANFEGAATELGRFTVNTIWGIGGILDPASSNDIHLAKQDEDFGQTLGVYGLGQGFYINWPIFGPSSPRDTAGMVGDLFLHPFTYLTTWDVSVEARTHEKVNDTSLSIGDYESLKEAAIDPYIAIRDAYVQHRLKKVKEKGAIFSSEDASLQKKK
jgi:phospholipid-binding lipoprotein MlaA